MQASSHHSLASRALTSCIPEAYYCAINQVCVCVCVHVHKVSHY